MQPIVKGTIHFRVKNLLKHRKLIRRINKCRFYYKIPKIIQSSRKKSPLKWRKRVNIFNLSFNCWHYPPFTLNVNNLIWKEFFYVTFIGNKLRKSWNWYRGYFDIERWKRWINCLHLKDIANILKFSFKW